MGAYNYIVKLIKIRGLLEVHTVTEDGGEGSCFQNEGKLCSYYWPGTIKKCRVELEVTSRHCYNLALNTESQCKVEEIV